MHPAYIRAALHEKKFPPIRIAERLDVYPSAVSGVINGKVRSRRIALEVSRVVGKPISVLWPGAYDTPRKRRRQRCVRAA